MELQIFTKHITLDDKAREMIGEKLHRLDHFMRGAQTSWMEAEIIKTTDHHKKGTIFDVELKLHYTNTILKASVKDESILNAIDRAKEEIERQLLKLKGMRQASSRDTRKAVRKIRGKV